MFLNDWAATKGTQKERYTLSSLYLMKRFSVLRYQYAYKVKQSCVKLIGFVLLAAVSGVVFDKEYVPGRKRKSISLSKVLYKVVIFIYRVEEDNEKLL